MALILLSLSITGCTAITGSGDVIEIDVPVESFDRLVVSHAFEVNVTVGEVPSLTVRVDDNLENSLDLGIDGNTLRIGLEPRTVVNNATLEADLTVVSLDSIDGSGAVEIHLSTLSGSDFELQLSGASALDGPVDFESMTAEVSGASDVALSGRVGVLAIQASGASNLSLLELEVDDLRIDLSGASEAEITVNRSIEASLSGASALRYRGDADLNTVDMSGASTIGEITEPG